MSPTQYAIREYRAGDEAAVLALLRQALGDGRAFDRSTAFWQWKHFQNPFGPSLMIVAEHEGLLGLRAFMRWSFRWGSRTVAAVRAVDTATHPEYRRLGVFSTLTRRTVEHAQTQGIDLIFNTPNRVSLPGYLKLGWIYLGRPAMLLRVLRPLRVAQAFLSRSQWQNEQHELPHLEAGSVPDLLAHRETVDHLLEQNDQLSEGRMRTKRSIEFLQWRYASAPSLPYYACWRGPRPSSAAVIFRPGRRRGLREILLSEILLSPDGLPVFGGLIRDVIGAGQADYLVAHASPGTWHWRALRTAGFIPIPRVGADFTVRPLRVPVVAPLDLSTWSLSLGDLEVF